MTKHTVNAAGRTLGRLATEVAVLLRGKNSPAFQRHLLPMTMVEVINLDQIRITAKKGRQKTYVTYSGYPGGIKRQSLDKLRQERGPEEVLRRAVYGMIPNNRLRPKIMKHLICHR
ncbi:MAG: 50S ribosomal protein L13 [Patescibacteria group bacterium]